CRHDAALMAELFPFWWGWFQKCLRRSKLLTTAIGAYVFSCPAGAARRSQTVRTQASLRIEPQTLAAPSGIG
ncbi:hypothetical protein, partial [Mesorhizobium abyssinicae]|uniref:hypothetical protein n=1 Tax=Mesorhizobium abyssinicae TaxID=1209958 RepID=UPI003CEBF780